MVDVLSAQVGNSYKSLAFVNTASFLTRFFSNAIRKQYMVIYEITKIPGELSLLKHLTPTCDQERISPYKINTISIR